VLKLVAFIVGCVDQEYLDGVIAERVWSKPGKHPRELFDGGAHDVAALLERYDADWRWLLTRNKTAI
jgi:hypothetical protein